VTTSLHRVVADVGKRFGAHIAVLDVGPNFGAINRAALIAADYVLVPVAPDLFSMQGLENVGPRLATWRKQWDDRLSRAPELDFELPNGVMTPLGYVVARHSVLAGGAVKAFQRWIDRMPDVFFRCPSLIGSVSHWIINFRGDHYLAAKGCNRFTKKFLVFERPVCFGRIKKSHTKFKGPSDQLDSILLTWRSTVGKA